MALPEKASPVQIGDRIRHYRQELGLSLSQLARDAGISKGYLWSLENPKGAEQPRPSGDTVYVIAQALGVDYADLLGYEMELKSGSNPGLEAFAREANLPHADVEMLASIRWRGEPPHSVERWRYIYQAIVTSRSLDAERS